MSLHSRFACVAVWTLAGVVSAEVVSRDQVWTTIPAMPADVTAMTPWIRPQAGQAG